MIDKIIVHHSGTADGPELSWGAIRKWHIEHNGWLDIGYHAGVELINDHYEVLMGRPTYMSGAHTIGQNSFALGICFVGDFNKTVPPDGQLKEGAKKISEWLATFELTKDKIYMHKQFNDTDCPGSKFDLDKLKSLVVI